MLGEWLRGPSADNVTLEAIGLIKGLDPRPVGWGHEFHAKAAGKFAQRIDKVLRREDRVLDHQVRDLLTQTRNGLAKLSRIDDRYETDYGTDRPNRSWRRQFYDLHDKLNNLADRVFDGRFAESIVAKHGHKDEPTLKRDAKRDLGVEIAMRGGQLYGRRQAP